MSLVLGVLSFWYTQKLVHFFLCVKDALLHWFPVLHLGGRIQVLPDQSLNLFTLAYASWFWWPFIQHITTNKIACVNCDKGQTVCHYALRISQMRGRKQGFQHQQQLDRRNGVNYKCVFDLKLNSMLINFQVKIT